MANERYVILASAFALSTSPKCSCNVIAGSTFSLTLVEIGVSIDAASGRCLVELFESSGAANGSGSTATGAKQIGGFIGTDTIGPNCTYGTKYTTNPTTITVLKSWRFPAPGPFVIQFPLGREPQSLTSVATKYRTLGIQLTVDTGTPNSDSYLEWEE